MSDPFICPVGSCGLSVPAEEFPIHVRENHKDVGLAIAEYLRHDLKPKLAQRVEEALKSPQKKETITTPVCT